MQGWRLSHHVVLLYWSPSLPATWMGGKECETHRVLWPLSDSVQDFCPRRIGRNPIPCSHSNWKGARNLVFLWNEQGLRTLGLQSACLDMWLDGKSSELNRYEGNAGHLWDIHIRCPLKRFRPFFGSTPCPKILLFREAFQYSTVLKSLHFGTKRHGLNPSFPFSRGNLEQISLPKPLFPLSYTGMPRRSCGLGSRPPQ